MRPPTGSIRSTTHRSSRRPIVLCLFLVPAVFLLVVGPMVLFPTSSLIGVGVGGGGVGSGIRIVNNPPTVAAVDNPGDGGDTLGHPSVEPLPTEPGAVLGHNHNNQAGGGPAEAVVDGAGGTSSTSTVTTTTLSSDKLTLVLMSYPGSLRFAVLIKILHKVVKWTFIEEVILVWNGDGDKVPPILTDAITAINAGARSSSAHHHRGDGDYVAPIRLLPQKHNRIDNRWRLANTIKTQAILNMDDDVNLYEDGAKCMFNVWRSSPQSIISVDVRSHFKHSERSGKGSGSKVGPFGPWGYIARDTFSDPNTDMAKKYSIGLPRVLLTSRQHLLDYEAAWMDESSGLRDIVDRLLCDDIALNFVAANKTEARRRRNMVGRNGGGDGMGAPGVIYAKAHFEPYPESHSNDSLYKKKGMKEKRQRCVNELAGRFGMSLQPRSWHVLCSVDG